MFIQPGREQLGMVPPCVVHNEDHQTALSAVADELFQEAKKGLGVERFLLSRHEPSSAEAHSTEHADTLAGRCMQHDRVNVFRGYPHGTA